MSSNMEAPFIKRFKTSRKHYVYDVNTNRLLEVEPPVYDVLGDYGQLSADELREKHSPAHGLEAVDQAISEIEEVRQNDGLLLSDRPETLFYEASREEIESYYTEKLDNIVLGVTEHCNLSCQYCPWEHLRTGDRHRMPVQTALASIDFLREHSQAVDGSLFVSFYGGEPLLEFDLIRECVDYAEAQLGDRCLFSVTTNGTLVDEERAEFLAEHEFKTIVSIDGPKRFHDRHRIDRHGKGSFDRATRGLQTLLHVYGELYEKKLKINTVVTPPYDYDAVGELWEELPWLPEDFNMMVSSVVTDFTDFLEDGARNRRPDVAGRTMEHQKAVFKDALMDEAGEPSPIGISLFERGLLRIHARPFWPGPRTNYPLNGCCIPGTRKLYIETDGTFHVCERAHGTPAIGSLEEGFDDALVCDIIETYARESIGDCRSCWAVGMCNLCFNHAYVDGKFSLERKCRNCESVRKDLEQKLMLYCTIREEDEHALDYMQSMALS